MNNFWIEEGKTITYEQFLIDLKLISPVLRSDTYNYYLSLIKTLCKGQKINTLYDIFIFLRLNSKSLFFNIDTSGTTGKPKKISVSLDNCIRMIRQDEDKNKIWAFAYPYGSFASSQVFFQAFFNQQCFVYCFYNDFKKVYQLFLNYKITNLACTPTFLKMMSTVIHSRITSVKKITLGGERYDSLFFMDRSKISKCDYKKCICID